VVETATPAFSLPNPFKKYEPCRCQSASNINVKSFTCPCGNKHDVLPSTTIIHFKNRHWRLQCAFEMLLQWMMQMELDGCMRPVYEHMPTCLDENLNLKDMCCACWAATLLKPEVPND